MKLFSNTEIRMMINAVNHHGENLAVWELNMMTEITTRMIARGSAPGTLTDAEIEHLTGIYSRRVPPPELAVNPVENSAGNSVENSAGNSTGKSASSRTPPTANPTTIDPQLTTKRP